VRAGALEARFDANVALVDAGRVRKLVGDSRRLLPDLAARDERFDFIYVDGSHHALDVIVDAALSWSLLDDGGVLVFDDYSWDPWKDDPLRTPRPAVDAFLTLVQGRFTLEFTGYQLGIRKTARVAAK
jgi:predicted O-methyltransferase YrrM